MAKQSAKRPAKTRRIEPPPRLSHRAAEKLAARLLVEFEASEKHRERQERLRAEREDRLRFYETTNVRIKPVPRAVADRVDRAIEKRGQDVAPIAEPPPPRLVLPAWDTTELINPGVETIDGHHGHEIERALKVVCGATYDRPLHLPKIADRDVAIGPGFLMVPPPNWRPLMNDPGGLSFRSIRELKVKGNHTRILGYGNIPAVINVDGCPHGEIIGVKVEPRRAHGGGRMDVPDDAVRIWKKHSEHNYPQQSHFRFEGVIEGSWKNAAIRCGTPGWNQAQEDHYSGRVVIYGMDFDVWTADAIDLCQYGLVGGTHNWANTRRVCFEYVAALWVGCAIRSTQCGMTVDRLHVDSCRDVAHFGGAQNKLTIKEGEAENCQRFILDVINNGNDQTFHIADFYGKYDLWRPDLPGMWAKNAPLDALGVWSTGGGAIFDNVTWKQIPVRRAPNGKLYYVTNWRNPDAEGKTFDFTTIPAPRIWLAGPSSYITNRDCAAHGYRAKPGYSEFFWCDSEHGGRPRVKSVDWKNVDVHGNVEKIVEGNTFHRATSQKTPVPD
jgi:hypothetical protein